MMDLGNFSMMDLFRVEAEQQTAALIEGLLFLEKTPVDRNHIEPLMRAAHSIKGAARLVGVPTVVSISHLMEDGFVAAQQGKIVLTADHVDVLLKAVDMISRIAALNEADEVWLGEHQGEFDALLNALDGVLNSPPAVTSDSHEIFSPEITFVAHPVSDETAVVEGAHGGGLSDFSMLSLFRMEVEQQAVVLTEGLLALEQDPASVKRLEPLMRSAHSVKGAARLVGVSAAVKVAHRMEDVFVAAQEGKLMLNADHVDALLKGVDMISRIATLDGPADAWVSQNQVEYDALLVSLDAILQGEKYPVKLAQAPIAQPAVSPPLVPVRKEPEAPAKDRALRISSEQLNRLMGLAGESMVESRWVRPYTESMLRLKRGQAELISSLDGLRDLLEAGRRDDQVQAQLRDAQRKIASSREFLAERLAELEAFDNRLNNLSWRLRREVIASRMRPFADGIHGFSRMVRDVARSLGKDVQLEIAGQETMVDREILEKVEAPLNHLLRNAVDHGVEMPDERIKAGKPAKGTLYLSAYHQSGMLSIVLDDDGRGVDLDKLRKKVLDRGLVSPDMATNLSEAELLEFLFLPGFTTRDAVSEISGRGVGLDVVHDTVQEMRGTVRVISHPGKGTRFHMQLPLTLSVIPALLVEIAGEPYAFPLARIERIFRPEQSEIESIEGHQFTSIGGQRVGLVSAAQILGAEGITESPDTLSVVVLADRDEKYGLVVERFLGERDLVVHVLPPRLGKVADISAAALMEDGSPVLIIDVDDMLHSIKVVAKEGRLIRIGDDAGGVPNQVHGKRILVVDDSITVREVERNLLESIGYEVDVAVDGVDGWSTVRAGEYSLVITDVDMPRMDGIELVRMIKQDANLRHTPVMIVSYKDREEDRRRGLNAGADYYLTKGSFHDDTLRQAVHDLIGEPVR
ncbi:MAG: hybrid sensor histidine kinase/response regulator [Gammaproteobacteria bacterium]